MLLLAAMGQQHSANLGATPAGSAISTPRFAATLEQWGDSPALLLTTGDVVTYSDLAGEADAFAARLTADVRFVSLEMAPEVAAIAAYLGALRAGVPALLHSGGPSADSLMSATPPDAFYSRHGDYWTLQIAPQPWPSLPAPELAILLSTSGSTGGGRLVRLSGGNLQANADSICEYLELDARDRAISTLPLSYSYGLSVLNSHLNVGASVVLSDCSVSASGFGEMLERFGVTGIAGVPYSYELMHRAGLLERLPRNVRTLTQAGGRMAPELVRHISETVVGGGRRLFVMYGQTEATARMAYLPPSELASNIGNIGRAIPGGRLWIAGKADAPAPIGDEGELVYEGPNVMLGYATSRADFASEAGPQTLRTGDLGREVAPGMFQITGRKSRFVKIFGLRIGLDALEARLEQAGAAVRLAGDDALVAIGATDAASLSAARAMVSILSVPTSSFEFVLLAEFPQLSNGKADHQRLLGLAKAQRAAAGTASQMQQTERLFTGLAKGREATEADSFESLGGDSLSYVECSIAIEEALGHLPNEWWRLSLGELRTLAPVQPANPKRQKWRFVETDTLVRSLAILAVVALHAGAPLRGGADVLMVLAGYNWARFQRIGLINGQAGRAFRDFAFRYVSIFLTIVCLASIQNGSVEWRYLLLVSNYVDGKLGILNIYWFLECLTWIVGMVCGLSLIPAVRRFAQRSPLSSAMILVAVGLAARAAGTSFVNMAGAETRRPDQMLIYFAVGWAFACTASAPIRSALFILLCGLSALAWPLGDTHAILMAGAGLLMIATPRVRLPRPVSDAVLLLSAASFYIYIFNVFPMYLGDQILHAPHAWFWMVNVPLALGLGIGTYKARGWVAARSPGWTARSRVFAARWGLGAPQTSPSPLHAEASSGATDAAPR